MFHSGLFYQDLIFNDEAVRLVPIEPEMQNYEAYLGADFIGQIRNLDYYMCVPTSNKGSATKFSIVSIAAVLLSLVLSL